MKDAERAAIRRRGHMAAALLRRHSHLDAALDVEKLAKSVSASRQAAQEASSDRLALYEALRPSAETRAAYEGEFRFDLIEYGEGGEETKRTVDVPWSTIEQIMLAIVARAEGKAKP